MFLSYRLGSMEANGGLMSSVRSLSLLSSQSVWSPKYQLFSNTVSKEWHDLSGLHYHLFSVQVVE